MNLTQSKVSHGLVGKFTPNPPSSTRGQVGSELVKLKTADVIYVIKATAAAANDEVEFPVHSPMAFVTGNVVLEGGGLIDFEGGALPDTSKIHAIRITAAATNTAVVGLGGTNDGILPGMDLRAGMTVLVDFPDGGLAITDETISAFFGAAGDSVVFEVLTEV